MSRGGCWGNSSCLEKGPRTTRLWRNRTIVGEAGVAELDEDEPPDDDLERHRRKLVRHRRRAPSSLEES